MKSASISTLKNNLSAYLDLVREGETVVITDRGRPVARLVPLDPSDASTEDARRAELERRGVIRRGVGSASALRLDLLPPPPHSTGDVLAALLDERADDR